MKRFTKHKPVTSEELISIIESQATIISHGQYMTQAHAAEISMQKLCESVETTGKENANIIGELRAEEKYELPVIIDGPYTENDFLKVLAIQGPPPPFRTVTDRMIHDEFMPLIDERIDWVVEMQCLCHDMFGEIRKDFALEYDAWWKSKQAQGV